MVASCCSNDSMRALVLFFFFLSQHSNLLSLYILPSLALSFLLLLFPSFADIDDRVLSKEMLAKERAAAEALTSMIAKKGQWLTDVCYICYNIFLILFFFYIHKDCILVFCRLQYLA